MGLVGVFDSGVGGLTVLRQLRALSPCTDFIYVADQAFCPYGVKPPQQICNRAVAISRFLCGRGVEMLVVACNTASVHVEEIRRQCKVPVLDVISSTCDAVLRFSPQKVALLATHATVQSGVYQRFFSAHGVQTAEFCCSSFVPLVERRASPQICRRIVSQVLADLPQAQVDAVVLGCTHFPYLLQYIAPLCGGADVVCCSKPVAEVFAHLAPPGGTGEVHCFTTGSPTSQYGYRFTSIEI